MSAWDKGQSVTWSADDPSVRKTGGEIDQIVGRLIANAHDSNPGVRNALTLSLTDLGLKQSKLVITAIVTFVTKQSAKIKTSHRVQLLNILITILEQGGRDEIDDQISCEVIAFAARELVQSVEVQQQWQDPACQILTLMSSSHCAEVMDRLLKLFQPGVLPHYYVMKTLAEVAAANGVGFTLRLKDVMGRLLPCLGIIKAPPMKWVFATALGRFAEAIRHFQSNASPEERHELLSQGGAIDADGQRGDGGSGFQSEMASAFDMLYSKWLGSKEAKLRHSVCQSLGYMMPVLSRSDLVKRFPGLIQTYLGLLKKEKPSEHLPITAGLLSSLGALVQDPECELIEELSPAILAGLHPLVCREPDYRQPNTLRNHTELLRCFEVLARVRLDDVLSFVIGRFQLKEARNRVGSLLILKHFVNSLNEILGGDKKHLLISSLNTLVEVPEDQVRRCMLQLIVGMSQHEYLTLEGGQELVKFVVDQAARKVSAADKANTDKSSPAQIKQSASHILAVMATKVPSTHPVLWPFCLELLNDPRYSPAIPVLLQVIGHIAMLKRRTEDPDYVLDFEHQVNLPSPQHIMSRLLVLACQPFGPDNANYFQEGSTAPSNPGTESAAVGVGGFATEVNLGICVVRAMGALGANIHPKIGEYWEESWAALEGYLRKNPIGVLRLGKWQDTVLKFFKETIAVVSKMKWLHELCEAMMEQFKLYPKNHTLRRCIQRFLGALLAAIEDKKLIAQTIDTMLRECDNRNDEEVQGCAQGLGLAGNMHLDIVLPKITALLGKADEKVKSKGFFGFGGSSKNPEAIPIRCAAALSYGYVSAYAHPELLLSRLDVHVLHNLEPVLKKAAEIQASPEDNRRGGKPSALTPGARLKLHLLKSLDLIGKALHISRLPEMKKDYQLGMRDRLVKGVLAIAKKLGPGEAALRLQCLQTMSTLANLEPALPDELRCEVADVVFKFFEVSTVPGTEDPKKKKGKKGKTGKSSEKAKSTDKAKKTAAAAAAAEEEEKKDDLDAELEAELDSEDDDDDEDGSIKTTLPEDSELEDDPAKLDNYDIPLPTVELMEAIIQLAKSFILMDDRVETLLSLLRRLTPYTCSEKLESRRRATAVYLAVLRQFVQQRMAAANAEAEDEVDRKGASDDGHPLPELGRFVGQIIPRASDSLVQIRQTSVEIVQALLYINQILEDSADVRPKQDIKLITEIKNRIGSPNARAFEDRLQVLQDLTALLCQILEAEEITHLLATLLDSLLDPYDESALGTVEVLKAVIALQGGELQPHLVPLVENIVATVKRNERESVEKILLEALRILTNMHFDGVLDVLMGSPVPLTEEISKCFLALFSEEDEQLASLTLNRVHSVLNETPLQKDKPTPVVQTATAALGVILEVKELQQLIFRNYPAVFCSILMRIGTANRVDDGGSSRDAVKAMKVFLTAMEEQEVLERMEAADAWKVMLTPSYDDAVTTLTKIFCEIYTDRKRALLKFLAHFYSQQSYEGQRVVATAMLAEFVCHSATDPKLLRQLVGFLLPRIADKLAKVRKQALRGLGNLQSVWTDEGMSAQAPAVLTALTTSFEDPVSEVAAEAVASLTKVVSVVDETMVAPVLINICFRLRPAFDRKEVSMRASALKLFAALTRFGAPIRKRKPTSHLSSSGNSSSGGGGGGEEEEEEEEEEGEIDGERERVVAEVRGNFLDQLHGFIPTLIVHMYDPETSIRKQCRLTFAAVARICGREMREIVRSTGGVCVEANTPQLGYDTDWAPAIAEHLALRYAERTRGYVDGFLGYFNSQWAVVRGNAVVALSHFLAASSQEARRTVNVNGVVDSILKQLVSNNENVRSRTAKALSFLHGL